jgi:nitrogen fixation NifU-like protein
VGLPPFLDHFRNPRGVGALEHPTHTGAAEDAHCGDRIEVDLRVESGRIVDARCRVRGCAASIAAASALAESLPGREAGPGALAGKVVVRLLGGIPPGRRHALDLVEAALKSAFPPQ